MGLQAFVSVKKLLFVIDGTGIITITVTMDILSTLPAEIAESLGDLTARPPPRERTKSVGYDASWHDWASQQLLGRLQGGKTTFEEVFGTDISPSAMTEIREASSEERVWLGLGDGDIYARLLVNEALETSEDITEAHMTQARPSTGLVVEDMTDENPIPPKWRSLRPMRNLVSRSQLSDVADRAMETLRDDEELCEEVERVESPEASVEEVPQVSGDARMTEVSSTSFMDMFDERMSIRGTIERAPLPINFLTIAVSGTTFTNMSSENMLGPTKAQHRPTQQPPRPQTPHIAFDTTPYLELSWNYDLEFQEAPAVDDLILSSSEEDRSPSPPLSRVSTAGLEAKQSPAKSHALSHATKKVTTRETTEKKRQLETLRESEANIQQRITKAVEPSVPVLLNQEEREKYLDTGHLPKQRTRLHSNSLPTQKPRPPLVSLPLPPPPTADQNVAQILVEALWNWVRLLFEFLRILWPQERPRAQ